MNKEEILRKIKIHDTEQIPKLKRLLDVCNQASKYYEVVISDFLSPDLHVYLPQLMFHYPELSYQLVGGYEEAEYKRFVVFPDFLESPEDVVVHVDICYEEKYGNISHRDVLGAVLGLGLKREVIGDILLETGHVQVMTSAHVATFLERDLVSIGRVKVQVSIASHEVMAYEPDFQMIFSTVKSLRLDAVIASGYQLSRSKAVSLIKSEKVKLNHNVIISTSKEVQEGDLISIRGKGRIRLSGIHGLSKKERFKIEIKKYV